MNKIYLQFTLTGDAVAAFERAKASRFLTSNTEAARSLLLEKLSELLRQLDTPATATATAPRSADFARPEGDA
jgi:hypothetical protein